MPKIPQLSSEPREKETKLTPPKWMGRPISHRDHDRDLEIEAAINEFGPSHMPRAQAEEKAYKSYLNRQHTEAAAHHLAGMKSAHAAGDMDSARKHSVMYSIHSNALGHDSVGPAHPAVAAHMESNPSKVKFKSHHGDLFALTKPSSALNITPSPPLKKSESDVNAWARSELKNKKKSRAVPCICLAYPYPHRVGGGKCEVEK